MDIKNVRTFLQIVETNNFTKAAEILGYSQSAVTAQIKQLEAELQAPLFDRMGKKIRLTSHGEQFLPHALNLVREEDAAFAEFGKDRELTGTIRIGTSSSLADWVLPAICAGFNKLHPKVHFIIKSADHMEYLHDGIKESFFDFVYCNYETMPPEALAIACETAEPVVFVVNSKHELAKKKKVTLGEVLEYPLQITDREVGYMHAFLDAVRAKGYEINAAIEMASLRGLISIVESSDGVSYVPYYSVASKLKSGRLSKLDVDIDIAATRVMLVYHKDKWVSPEMRAFMEYFEEHRVGLC